MDQARLQEMWDHHEIRQLLATYCHGCDRSDETEMASVYCGESWDDHGENKCDGKEFARRTISGSDGIYDLVSHVLGQSLIKVDGDKAGTETYFIATVRFTDDGGKVIHHMGGRYVDTLEREDGAWRIKKRLCVREWSYSQSVDADWLADSGFIETRRGPSDVSWEALGLKFSGPLPVA